LGSAFIYLSHWGFSLPWLNSIIGILTLYLLLPSDSRVWSVTGFFTGILWFWWIALSFNHYQMPWAIPIVVTTIGLLYAILFWAAAFLAEKAASIFYPPSSILHLTLKAAALLGFSYVHPFGFDWFKPELMFVESYFGIEKWQFTIILIAIVLTLWKKQAAYLLIALLAWQPLNTTPPELPEKIQIVSTQTNVEEKWDKTLHPAQFKMLFSTIDKAIEDNKTLIVLPESVFPVFLSRSSSLIDALREKAKKISIVTGGLYWDGKTPRN
jgi:apolipoprotein N-acyltransferase